MLNKDNNPWLGLASYEYEDAYRFFGREKELEKLKECVSSNLITTIYGISGSGKTSLINAGMCPLIEKENFLPVRIRLEHRSSKTYSQQIIKAVTEAMNKVNGEIEVNDELENPELIPEKEKLWMFFYASTFWSETNHHIYPIVFIDQFEEIFTKNDDEEIIRDFFESISALQYENPPAAITHALENGERHTNLNITQDFRVVLIMREDFLARLEDYAYDSPALRKNRVGIKRMNGNQALEVITKPIPGLVSRDVAMRIIAKVVGRSIKDTPAFLEQLSVDTSLLSLFCSEVYLKAAEQKHETITRELIDQFGENILASFYSNTMKLVPQPTAEYLETHLLTRSGFRNAVAMEDIVADGIRKEDLDKLCAKRLIRIETSEGTERVEFTHDVLCAIAKEHRDQVLEKASRKQSNSRTINFLIDLAVPFCFFLPLVFYLYVNNDSYTFLGVKSKEDFFVLLVATIIILFNIFIICPYRHTRDRNAIFNSLVAWTINGFLLALIASSTNPNSDYLLWAFILAILFYLIQFIGSFRFNRKRSFKQAVKYTLQRQVYKDHPEMKTVLRVFLLVAIGFVSFLVGLSMNIRIAFISAPLCSLASFWLLCGLTGHTRRFNVMAILNYMAQVALVILILASQFYQNHLLITLLSLAALMALTVFYILKDEVPFTLGRKIRHMALIGILSFAVVPAINAGYNIYNHNQYHRIRNGVIDDYKIMRFLIVEDADHHQGVRDRWDIVVPVENDSIEKEVIISFDKDLLKGMLSFENVATSYLNNDVAFYTYNHGERQEWLCSEHIDMRNKCTSLIIEHITGDAISNSKQLKEYLSAYSGTIDPFTMELAIDHFLEREYDNNQRSHSLSDKAYFLLFTGNYAKAEQKAREALEIEPDYLYAYGNLFDALFLQATFDKSSADKKLDEAREIYDKCKDGTVSNMTFEESLFSDINELIEHQVIDSSIREDLASFLNGQ